MKDVIEYIIFAFTGVFATVYVIGTAVAMFYMIKILIKDLRNK